MKKIIIVLIMGLMLCLQTINVLADTPNEATPIDIYILSGQSNMAGVGRLSLIDDKYEKEYPNVKIYNGGQGFPGTLNFWDTVKPGQGIGQSFNNEATIGPEIGIASVLSNSDKEIGFIKYAYGGTAITNIISPTDNWHGLWGGVTSEGILYKGLFQTITKAINLLIAANYEPTIRGFFWMQGETDGEIQAGIVGANDYLENLTQFFSHVRTRLNNPDLPIVFGEIYEYSVAVKYVRIIVETQKIVGDLPNNYLVNTGDIPIYSSIDDWHWSGMTEIELGIRFGETMYEVLFMGGAK
jgi:hypothetical protein